MDSFSVVIPLHNAASLIEATLDSLAMQTIPPDEVIVVDDGSTDGSGEIARAYRFGDGSSPKVIRHETPLGVAVSRNHGVFWSRGQWIGLCDNDDIWHPRRIEMILESAARNPNSYAIATGATGFALDADRRALAGHQRSVMVNHWVRDDQVQTMVDRLPEFGSVQEQLVTFADLQQDTCFVTTVVCFRRETYAMAGGCATWTAPLGDWLLHAAVAQMGPITLVDYPLVFYRVRAASQSHQDAEIALSALAILLALRLGATEPDERPAGAIYRHLLRVGATGEFSVSRTLALATLGAVPPREIASILKANVRSRIRSRTKGRTL